MLGLLVAAAGAGAALVHFDTAPYQYAKNAAKGLTGQTKSPTKAVQKPATSTDADAKAASGPEVFTSTFFDLVGMRGPIDVTRGKGSGGGIAALEDGTGVLLTFEGRFFHLVDADDLTELTTIAPPFNGFEDYRSDARGRFADLEHRMDWFRYNDLAMIDGPGGRAFYASFTRYLKDDACYQSVIARLPVPAGTDLRALTAAQDDWEEVFASEPCLPLKSTARALEGHMAGGRITYDGVRHIYMGNGDYHFDGIAGTPIVSPDDAFEYGKVIEIDLAQNTHRIVSKGHRNMQGITTTPDGEVYVVEHGIRGGDELNHVREGRDYGWPNVTLGTKYDKSPAPGQLATYGRHDGYEAPVFSWLPSIAISSLNMIEGFHDSWDGDVMLASLRGQSLFRLRLHDGRLLFSERIEIGERIRYAQPIGDRLLLWLDSREVLFLEARPFPETSQDPSEIALAALDMPETLKTQVAAAFGACRECHALSEDDNYNAPSLAKVYRAPVAATAYADYSEALQSAGGHWTPERLAAFIADPESVAPGSTMPASGVEAASVIDGIVRLLKEIKER